MDPADLIDGYLRALQRILAGRGTRTLLAEVRDHLTSAAERFEQGGAPPVQAARSAIELFGDPAVIAAGLVREPLEEVAMWKRSAGIVALTALLAWVEASMLLSERAPIEVGWSFAAVAASAALVVGVRKALLGRVGWSGAGQVALVLLAAGPLLDWDGTAVGPTLALAPVGVGLGWLGLSLLRSRALPTLALMSLCGAPLLAGVVVPLGFVSGIDLRWAGLVLLVPFAAALAWLGFRLWSDPAVPTGPRPRLADGS